jgi:DNA-binding NtrC family response regulator
MLSDNDMGLESALEELPRLHALGVLPPTLVVSGFLDATTSAELTSLGPVLGTLAKPFDFTDLEARVQECLEALRAGAPGRPARGQHDWSEIIPARAGRAAAFERTATIESTPRQE